MKDNDISRLLYLVLRHKPGTIGLTLDKAGWAYINELLRLANEKEYNIDLISFNRVVEENDKKRFTVSSNGRCIRAAQGHSLSVDLNILSVKPPKILWHGTSNKNLKAIFEEGIKRGRRQNVHLSTDPATAYRVGKRHGNAVVISVNSDAMSCDGYLFYKSENDVWLTDFVPAPYLKVHEKDYSMQ
ncbi:RNA 2'-phosphotransferase [Asaia astilbis]|uniref:RNA 2'-phosphotransferase n=1 Tax=Asaia astilbis TaxID=610244 RepID=UPI00056897A6|nr:RNA 2'-phosphotransferase [Asaia astilbis]